MMSQSFMEKHKTSRDLLSIVTFIVLVIIGTLFINTFIFRSFNVEGDSMATTLSTGDRLIVNRVPVTFAQIQNKQYQPKRGQIIVFKNPAFDYTANNEEYIVKRVIAFAGERVVLKDGTYTVYNSEHPNGFNPDDDTHGLPGSPTSGSVDQVVTDNTIFVSGDHRQGNCSYDSRSGLGLIPLYDVVGPVSLRIFPFNKLQVMPDAEKGSGIGKANRGDGAACEEASS